MFDIPKYFVEVWQYKIVWIAADFVASLFCQVDDVAFFIDAKIEVFVQLSRALIADIIGFNPLHEALDALFLKPLHKATVFGHSALNLQ